MSTDHSCHGHIPNIHVRKRWILWLVVGLVGLVFVWFVFKFKWENLFFLLAMAGCFGGHFLMGHDGLEHSERSSDEGGGKNG